MLSVAYMFGIVILTIAACVSSGIDVAVAADASQGVVRRASALERSSVDDSEEAPRHRKSSKSKKKKRNSEDEDSDDDSESDDDDEPPAKPASKKRLPAKRSKAAESDDDEHPVSRSHKPASKPLKKSSTSLRSKKSSTHQESSGGGGSFLAKSGVATKITTLGNDVQKVVSDCLELVRKIGIDGEEPEPFENEGKGMMKERMARVEGSLSSVHKAVSSMERDMFGSAGTWDSSGKTAKGLKKKVSALVQNMKSIKGRMTALKKSSNTVALQIDKLEQGVNSLQQKASSLLQGLDSPAPEQPQLNPDASFSDRLNSLASYAETMEQTVANLEVELRGAETRSAPQSKTHGFSDKAKSLETLFKGLKTRLTSLEQEV
jgi:hypothetical protein